MKFVMVKLEDPIRARYGKHDGRMTGPLEGFWHTHLRDDAVLIYRMSNKVIHLVEIATHAEMEKSAGRRILNRISRYRYS